MPLRIYESSEKRGGKRESEGSWNFQNGFGQPLKGEGEEAREASEGGPVSVAAAAAVVRFVRLLMRACVAAACGMVTRL